MTPQDRLRLAASIYTVLSSGEVRGPTRLRKLNVNDSGYLRFGHKFEDGVRNVMVHRLAAYQKFGEAMFAPGIEVRHKDGNSQNNLDENILIGTHSENMRDVPEAVRIAKAGQAARKFTDEQVAEIRRRRTAGATLKKLGEEYGSPKSTIWYIVQGVTCGLLLSRVPVVR